MTRAKLEGLLREYGAVAVYTYLVIWLTVLGGFAIAISAGFRTQSTEGGAGVLIGAWVATKLTQPLRIGATLLLTPIIGTALRKWRGAPKSAQTTETER